MKRTYKILLVAALLITGDCVWRSYASEKLITSIKANKTAEVQYWLNHGANPNAIDYHDPLPSLHPTALLVAIDWRARCTSGHMIIEGYTPGDPAPENVEMVRSLIEKGANTEVQNSKGFTPLMIAAWQGKLETVKLLLSQGSPINIFSSGRGGNYMFRAKGDTALTMSIYGGDRHVVHFLLANGADFKTRFPNGEFSAYELAKVRGDLDIVAMMEKMGRD